MFQYLKSQHHGGHYPYYARWSQGKSDDLMWCAEPSRQSGDRAPWIKVRLSSWTKYVTYIRYKIINKGYNMHMELSMDGVQWRPYKVSIMHLYL